MKYSYGGQALIEGVMMRGKKNTAIAVRKTDGSISCKLEPIHSITEKYSFLKWPFVRGTVNLVESLLDGFRALTYSVNESADGEEEELNAFDLFISVALALVLGIGLFFVLPVVLAHLMNHWVSSSFWQNLLEGIIRVVIFLIYIVAISKMQDITRVFQYHGAEHKTIHAYENDKELLPENCQEFTTLHPRCGTSFLFLVMIVSIIMFSFLGVEHFWWRIISRVVLLPVVAGVSYEFLKYTSKHLDNPLIRACAWPGIQLQRLTTREPELDMLEVAIVALQKVREAEEDIPFQEIRSHVIDAEKDKNEEQA